MNKITKFILINISIFFILQTLIILFILSLSIGPVSGFGYNNLDLAFFLELSLLMGYYFIVIIRLFNLNEKFSYLKNIRIISLSLIPFYLVTSWVALIAGGWGLLIILLIIVLTFISPLINYMRKT